MIPEDKDNTVVKPMEHTQKKAEERYPEGQNLHMAYRQSYIQAIKDVFENPIPFGLATLGAYQYEKIHHDIASKEAEQQAREILILKQALVKIANMSNPGSYEKAITDMKAIAAHTLNTYKTIV